MTETVSLETFIPGDSCSCCGSCSCYLPSSAVERKKYRVLHLLFTTVDAINASEENRVGQRVGEIA